MHYSNDPEFVADVQAAESEEIIEPGDLVEHKHRELDPRFVVRVCNQALTLDIMGRETGWLVADNYRVVRKAAAL